MRGEGYGAREGPRRVLRALTWWQRGKAEGEAAPGGGGRCTPALPLRSFKCRGYHRKCQARSTTARARGEGTGPPRRHRLLEAS